MVNDIYQKWAKLGIAFSTKEFDGNPDPEKLLLDSAAFFIDDRKLLKLVLTWIKVYGDLIHMERLAALVKKDNFEIQVWFGGIAAFSKDKDRRWGQIEKIASGKKFDDFPLSQLERLNIDRQGSDKFFSNFGIKMPLINIDDNFKKLKRREYILKTNLWLRLRSLFGSNWRADIAWQIYLNPAQTPYQIAKTIGCNTETAYRNWQSLMEANILEFLAA